MTDVPVSDVVDPEWLSREVAAITVDLQRRHPDSTPGAVGAAVAEAAEKLSGSATIPNYLPVLVRRAADEKLGGPGADS